MSYKFFQNKTCEFFPCHKICDNKNFNCLFCFCPLYNNEDCGGNFTFSENHIKDCSHCLLPHYNYELIIKKLKDEK